MSGFTFKSEQGFDPTYRVFLDGRSIGVVAQDRSMRPLQWTAVIETPEPTPEYPDTVRFETVGYGRTREEAGNLLAVVASVHVGLLIWDEIERGTER